ncbi:MAG: DUF6541 family protein, partial [Chloroflexota bacterium]
MSGWISRLAADSAGALSWPVWLAAGGLLFVLPGWMLLAATWPGWKRLHFWARLGLSCSAGAAVYPLLLELAWLAGVQPGPALAWLPPGLAAAAAVWRGWARRSRPGGSAAAWRALWPGRLQPEALNVLVTGIVVAWVIVSRVWAIQGLVFPLWGDSYQHTMITQLLLDHGGLFASWMPYAELSTFTYHFGFHSLAAAFAWFSRLSAVQSVQVTGQIVNLMAVLSLFPLAARVGGSPWAGTAAVLAAGLVFKQPMFYTNWGRYPQLTGQVILPLLLLLIWTLARRGRPAWRPVLLSWICLAGLALTHYRILIFLLPFYPLALLLRRSPSAGLLRRLAHLGLAAVGGGLLFLPWFLHTSNGQILNILDNQLSSSTLPPSSLHEASRGLAIILDYYPAWLLIGVGLALAGLAWRRQALALAL